MLQSAQKHAEDKKEQRDREMTSCVCCFSFDCTFTGLRRTRLVLLICSRENSDSYSARKGCNVRESCESQDSAEKLSQLLVRHLGGSQYSGYIQRAEQLCDN